MVRLLDVMIQSVQCLTSVTPTALSFSAIGHGVLRHGFYDVNHDHTVLGFLGRCPADTSIILRHT